MARTRPLPMPEAATLADEDVSPVAPDPSGWTPHSSERRDFYHRVRVFPPAVSEWRKRLVAYVQANPSQFRDSGGDREEILSRIDEGISYLREVARFLAALYGSPDLGNKEDPTDELVYIILSRKTPE